MVLLHRGHRLVPGRSVLEVKQLAVSHTGHELLSGGLCDLIDGLDCVVPGVGQVNHAAQRLGPDGQGENAGDLLGDASSAASSGTTSIPK